MKSETLSPEVAPISAASTPDIKSDLARQQKEPASIRFIQFMVGSDGIAGWMGAGVAFFVSGSFGVGLYSLLFASLGFFLAFLFYDGQHLLAKCILIPTLVISAFCVGRFADHPVTYSGKVSAIRHTRTGEVIDINGGWFGNIKQEIFLPNRVGMADSYSVGQSIQATGEEITYHGQKQIVIEDSAQIVGEL